MNPFEILGEMVRVTWVAGTFARGRRVDEYDIRQSGQERIMGTQKSRVGVLDLLLDGGGTAYDVTAYYWFGEFKRVVAERGMVSRRRPRE